MRRTQIYLPPELSAALDRLARKRHTSRADLIREATRRFLEQESGDDQEALLGLIGMGESGLNRTSLEHDRILGEEAARCHRP